MVDTKRGSRSGEGDGRERANKHTEGVGVDKNFGSTAWAGQLLKRLFVLILKLTFVSGN